MGTVLDQFLTRELLTPTANVFRRAFSSQDIIIIPQPHLATGSILLLSPKRCQATSRTRLPRHTRSAMAPDTTNVVSSSAMRSFIVCGGT